MTRLMASSFLSGLKKQESTVFNPTTLQQLRLLVSKGEGQHLEFKRRASSPDKILREMIAFANTTGGSVLIGVGDDGTIPGLKFPEDEAHVINEALQKVRPFLNIHETFIPLESARIVIRYDIPESRCKPHFVQNPTTAREYFVRVNDKSIKASRELREIIKRKVRNRGIKFRYGDHEKFLMQYLEVNKSITLAEFIAASGLKKFYASNKLIVLVLANVLRIIPHEKGDLYALAFTKFS